MIVAIDDLYRVGKARHSRATETERGKRSVLLREALIERSGRMRTRKRRGTKKGNGEIEEKSNIWTQILDTDMLRSSVKPEPACPSFLPSFRPLFDPLSSVWGKRLRDCVSRMGGRAAMPRPRLIKSATNSLCEYFQTPSNTNFVNNVR